MPLRNAAYDALLSRQQNVVHPEQALPRPPRVIDGTLHHALDIAERPERAGQYDSPPAEKIRTVKTKLAARVAKLEAREATVRRLRKDNEELLAIDREVEDAWAAVGVDYDKRTIRYPGPLDNLSTASLVYLLMDHDDQIARACGEVSLDDLLAWAEKREEALPQ